METTTKKPVHHSSTVKFSYDNETVNILKFSDETTLDYLKPMVYVLRSSMFGFYLQMKTTSFEVPKEVFGSVQSRAERVINTFVDREKSTGILFTGDKGSGKTMLTNIICNACIEDLGMPVIIIEDSFSGSGFTNFIENIGSCVLLFDEFGKTYKMNSDNGNQEDLLSLLDGTSSVKRLNLFTENRETDISEFLLARPGRVYYHFKYKKLEADVIREVCEKNGIDKTMIQSIVDASICAQTFSFDILNAIVEESKRYGEPIQDILKTLNVGIDDNINIKMEAVKAIYVKTGEELKIPLAFNVFRKPLHEYDNNGRMAVAYWDEHLKSLQAKLGEKFNEYEHGRYHISIEFDDFKGEKDGLSLYVVDENSNNPIAITAKVIDSSSQAYIQYLS